VVAEKHLFPLWLLTDIGSHCGCQKTSVPNVVVESVPIVLVKKISGPTVGAERLRFPLSLLENIGSNWLLRSIGFQCGWRETSGPFVVVKQTSVPMVVVKTNISSHCSY
jgi:hypothetical protein